MGISDLRRDAVTAMRRFGLGPRPGELASIARDPRGFVSAQLSNPALAKMPGRHPTSAEGIIEVTAYQAAQKAQRDKAASAPADKTLAGSAAPEMAAPAPAAPAADRPTQLYRQEATAYLVNALSTKTPFLERLSMFWANLFCVSAAKSQVVRAIAGAYEREAIRPYVLGRFADMLKASSKHPAMLLYLDNDASVGPNSPAGQRRNVGLNENLAREILELHSLGVDGGYTQADVTELARIITGWRIARPRDPGAEVGNFYFDPTMHEPGIFTLLGRRYDQKGVRQGEAALDDLARHPSTAKYVARKFAASFVAENPPPALVESLAASFRASEGNLAAMTKALLDSEEAWEAPPAKFLPPTDFMIAAGRLVGLRPEEYLRAQTDLGQRQWEVPSPQGWPLGDSVWAAPDALLQRLSWATAIARRAAGTSDVDKLAEEALGPTLSPQTREAIARAESRQQGLALLLASSEFQTR